MLIVENDATRVDGALGAGQLACPHCGGELRPWGWARSRILRRVDGPYEHRPRRSCCRECRKTSVLLPDVSLLRRVDEAAVIGTALLERTRGAGQRTIAKVLGRPRETVRGWLRRFEENAQKLAAHFSAWAFALDARLAEIEPSSSPFGAALEGIGLATRAANILLGPRPVWSWASAMTGGRLVSNTNTPFPAPR